MPRKRHHDLREYWPWYQRTWPVRYGFHAIPPPFDLSDISRQKTTPTDKHIATVTLVALAILIVVTVVGWLFIA